MTRKFEAHITLPRTESDLVEVIADKIGWSFSAIDGDPVMGKQAYCYLTHYDTDGYRLLDETTAAARYAEEQGATVLRRKVEEILYDSKTGHDVLTGVR